MLDTPNFDRSLVKHKITRRVHRGRVKFHGIVYTGEVLNQFLDKNVFLDVDPDDIREIKVYSAAKEFQGTISARFPFQVDTSAPVSIYQVNDWCRDERKRRYEQLDFQPFTQAHKSNN
jgi:hypothetical protein